MTVADLLGLVFQAAAMAAGVAIGMMVSDLKWLDIIERLANSRNALIALAIAMKDDRERERLESQRKLDVEYAMRLYKMWRRYSGIEALKEKVERLKAKI